MSSDEELITPDPPEEPPKSDPLDGLVEKAAIDQSAPFQENVVIALVQLKEKDPCKFEVLRAQFKALGVTVHRLDKLISRVSLSYGMQDPTDLEILLGLIEDAEPFCTPDGDTAFIDLYDGDLRKTFAIARKAVLAL